MDRVQHRRPGIAALAIMLVMGGMLCAAPASANPLYFNIPAGRAVETLTQFGYQSGLDIFFDAASINDQPTQAVSGWYEPQAALEKMLIGSGLTFSVTKLGAISVGVLKNDRPEAYEPPPPQTVSGSRMRGTALRALSLVTGEVHIEGTRTINDIDTDASVEVRDYSREDLDRSGDRTTQDWLATLPFNFGGGPNEATHLGLEAMTNTAFGTGANLRGLGSRATVVLVNGRRLAPSGAEGTFTDIANIPLTAVDHIQVVGDGASTLYGEDAIGGVINFVLRGDSNTQLTQATVGGLTPGALGERLFSQALSGQWGETHGLLSLEYYQRDALFASQRAQANSDLTPWGGVNFNTPQGNPGTIIDNAGNLWGIPTGQNGVGLKPSDLIQGKPNLYSRYLDSTVLPREQRLSVLATGERPVLDDSSAWVEILWSRRRFDARAPPVTATLTVPNTNPFYVNPGSGDSVQVEYGFGNDFGPVTTDGHVDSSRVSVGFNHEFPRDWKVAGSLAYSEERQLFFDGNFVDFDALQTALDDSHSNTAFNPFGDGSHTNPDTLKHIRVTGHADYRSVFGLGKLSASGPVTSLPAGDLRLTMGVDCGAQTFSSALIPLSAGTSDTNRRRRLAAIYAEAAVPLFSRQSGLDRAPWLSLSIGVRNEFYSDVGQAFASQVELTFKPTAWVTFQAGIARLFRPPNLPDLSEAANLSAILPLPNPRAPGGVTDALVWIGGNADLKPESAQSIVAGWKFASASQPGLSASLTYFHTLFSNRIETIDSPGDAFVNPQESWLISEQISAQQRAQVCARSSFQGSNEACLTEPIGAFIDARTRNAATLKTDGVDVASRYKQDTPVGSLGLRLDAAYVLHYRQADTPISPIVELRNTDHNPPALRLRGTTEFERRAFWATAGVNFQSGYTDIDSPGHPPVASWMTTDLTLGYRLPSWALAFASEARVTLSAQNIFNRGPPFLNNTALFLGYDQENGNLLGRRTSMQLQVRW